MHSIRLAKSQYFLPPTLEQPEYPPESDSEDSKEDNELASPIAQKFVDDFTQNMLDHIDEIESSSEDPDLAGVDLFGDSSTKFVTMTRDLVSEVIAGVRLPDDFEPDSGDEHSPDEIVRGL